MIPENTDLQDILVSSALLRIAVLRVLQKYFIHVGAGVLKQLICAVEDYQCYFTVAQHAQFVRFLHQAKLTLRKSHLQFGKAEIWLSEPSIFGNQGNQFGKAEFWLSEPKYESMRQFN